MNWHLPTSRLTLKIIFWLKIPKTSEQKHINNRMHNVRKGNKKAYFLGIVTNLRSILRWRRKSSDGWNSIENSPFEKNISKQLSTRPSGHSPNVTSTQQKESTTQQKKFENFTEKGEKGFSGGGGNKGEVRRSFKWVCRG